MVLASRRFVRVLMVPCCALIFAGTTADARKASGRASTGLHADGRWRDMATLIDRDRLRDWRIAWEDALTKVKASPAMAAIAADPTLFDPDIALPDATLPPGAYRCRVTKLGGSTPAMRNVTRYPAVDCPVAADGKASSLHFASGVQRPVGMIFAEMPARSIFLGTLVLGDETRPLRYGEDDDRDMIGYVERIGDARWRLVLPRPRFESIVDVVEITPAR